MEIMELDELTIKNIRCECVIGCNADERMQKQPILLTVTLFLDTRNAAQSDDLSKTVNYSELCKVLLQFVKESEYQLIETLAEKVSECVLAFDARIQRVRLRLVKPQALSRADFPELVITRNAK